MSEESFKCDHCNYTAKRKGWLDRHVALGKCTGSGDKVAAAEEPDDKVPTVAEEEVKVEAKPARGRPKKTAAAAKATTAKPTSAANGELPASSASKPTTSLFVPPMNADVKKFIPDINIPIEEVQTELVHLNKFTQFLVYLLHKRRDRSRRVTPDMFIEEYSNRVQRICEKYRFIPQRYAKLAGIPLDELTNENINDEAFRDKVGDYVSLDINRAVLFSVWKDLDKQLSVSPDIMIDNTLL